MNICIDCKFHNGPSKGGQWYDHFCAHATVKREPMIECVSGVKGFNRGDKKNKSFAYEEHPHCREINTDGACSLYAKV